MERLRRAAGTEALLGSRLVLLQPLGQPKTMLELATSLARDMPVYRVP